MLIFEKGEKKKLFLTAKSIFFKQFYFNRLCIDSHQRFVNLESNIMFGESLLSAFFCFGE